MAEIDIERNERVVAIDGTEVGHVTHVIVDGPAHEVTDIVVHHNGQDMLVPISNVQRGAGNELTLRGTANQFAGAAGFNREGYHEVDADEIEGAPVRSASGNAVVEHADHNTVDIDNASGRTPERMTGTPAPARQGRGNEEITVPIVEEQLRAGVREREAGRFRLRKDVVTEQQTIDVPVQHEEVYVTERAVNRAATREELATMDRDIEIPLREQEVVTSKQAVVTGEVGIRKETTTETQRVTDSVRREEVRVEDAGSARVHAEGFAGTAGTRHDAMSEGDRARYTRFTQQERAQYDAMTPEQQRTWGAEYDRRNPIQKIEDKMSGRD